uniref:NACHT, LRR and PYD domains-containing protein 3-like isoform X5 n=1 Tax=Geotrypetes seraphini TaxID=260995 RepID=A0A6P8QZJ7_GEOSA|nr:NACHT, LRR and PYD domains-containing protein 3-like isoform X5 [Geotrypetes seraphini]
MEQEYLFILEALESLGEDEFKRFKFCLSIFGHEYYSHIPQDKIKGSDRISTVQLLREFSGREAMNVTIKILEQSNLRNTAFRLQQKIASEHNQIIIRKIRKDYRQKYMETMIEEYQVIEDKNSRLGESILLNKRYIPPIIIKKHRWQEDDLHQIVAGGNKDLDDLNQRENLECISIGIDKLFEPNEHGLLASTVVLQGPSGIGKTTTLRKIMLDWASGNIYEKFDYIFYLSCKEMKLIQADTSLAELLLSNCKDPKTPVSEILANPENLLFLIDGFDELRFSLDYLNSKLCSDPHEKASISCIFNGLLRRTVLDKSHLLITTWSMAAEKLKRYLVSPCSFEILGFSPKGQEVYFSNFFEDEQQAKQAYTFVQGNKMVYSMCFAPIVCWSVCTVFQQQFESGQSLDENLTTSTSLFVFFVTGMLNHCSCKQTAQKHLQSLSSLAEEGMRKHTIVFEEEQIKKHNLDAENILALFLNKNQCQEGTMSRSTFSFVHFTFQEFFAALFFVLEAKPQSNANLIKLLKDNQEKTDGFLTATVRFLFGLLNGDTVGFIQKNLACKVDFQIKEILMKWVMVSATKNPPLKEQKLLELLHYLFETQDVEFVKAAMERFTEISLSSLPLTVADCLALTFCINYSYKKHTLHLQDCQLGYQQLDVLMLGIANCLYLSLSDNKLEDSSVKLLCEGLKQPDCELQSLTLYKSPLTSDGIKKLMRLEKRIRQSGRRLIIIV